MVRLTRRRALRREAAMTTYWIAQREDDVEGQGLRIRYLRPAEPDEVEGQAMRRGLGETDEDVDGQLIKRGLVPEEDDVAGAYFKRIAPIDERQGTYLVEIDTDDDVTGQYARAKVLGETEDDVEGQRRGMP